MVVLVLVVLVVVVVVVVVGGGRISKQGAFGHAFFVWGFAFCAGV